MSETYHTASRPLSPGQMEVLADGGVRWRGRLSGDMYHLTAEEFLGRDCETAEQFAQESRDRNGYEIVLATVGPFPSGATLQTDGSKIVGRTEPDPEAAQKARDVRPRTAREAIFAINVAMHEAWDAAAQSAKSSPHPSPFAAKTLFRSPDMGGTSHLHGSAHLLPKG